MINLFVCPKIALYNVIQSERKERDPEDSSFGGASLFGIHGIKTMIIVSEYELEFNAEEGVFRYQQG